MTWRAVYCDPGPVKRDRAKEADVFYSPEILTRDRLVESGFEVYCPFERVVERKKNLRRRGFADRTIERAAFARYLFVNSDEFSAIEAVRGVGQVVKVGGSRLKIKDETMAAIMALGKPNGCRRDEDETKPSFGFKGVTGDRFVFAWGSPFEGFIGELASIAKLDKTGEVQAYIDFMGSQREVTVKREHIGPLKMQAENSMASGIAQAA